MLSVDISVSLLKRAKLVSKPLKQREHFCENILMIWGLGRFREIFLSENTVFVFEKIFAKIFIFPKGFAKICLRLDQMREEYGDFRENVK